MYGQPQSFGHFGAPDQLNSSYGESFDMMADVEQPFNMMDEVTPSYSVSVPYAPVADLSQVLTTGYKREGKPLPFIKGGATDAGVKSKTGIEGLISEIQASMGLSPTGSITDAQIRTFQKTKGLKEDGVIGKASYAMLGFTPPYPKSSSGGSIYNPSTDKAIAEVPFYQKTWFQYTALGLVVAATGFVLFYPRKEE